jgi:uncharacterized protein YecE (DUF72 family)
MNIKIGTAAWTIAKDSREEFPEEGSHLQRYSQVLTGVEINSSFYKDHLPKSYARWAEETPPGFEFSVKLQKRFTHDQRLVINEDDLAEWYEGVSQLGQKLGVILVQLPPSLLFKEREAERFFRLLREVYDEGVLAFEPRHTTWASDKALSILNDYRITKVEADPELVPMEVEDLPRTGTRYMRLHGSPEIYKSQYSDDYLDSVALDMRLSGAENFWVIFDNTTFGYATEDALKLQTLLHFHEVQPSPHNSRNTLVDLG